MAERDAGPEPDGADRPGVAGVPGEPVTPRPESGSAVTPAAGAGSITAVTDHSPVRTVHRRGQQAADLRQKLDEKAAATDELREALDELRQVLDVDKAPPAAGTGRRRTRLIAVLGIVLAAVVVAAWLLLDRGADSIVADGPAPGSSTAASNSASNSASDSAAVPSAKASSGPAATTGASGTQAAGTVPVRPLPWPGGAVTTPRGMTTTGVGATTPGTDVQVAVDPDGTHLDVFERLLLDKAATDALSLAAPTLPALSATAQVEGLQVQLDDTAVPVAADGPTSWTAQPPPSGSYTRVTLRYRMSAGVALVTPAAPGRALGIVTPLTGVISVGHGFAVQVRSADPHVIGISCPAAPTGAVCGSRSAAGWTATVPSDSQRMIVLLQLNTTKR